MWFVKPKGFGNQQAIYAIIGGGVLSALFFLSPLAHPLGIVLMGFSPLPLYGLSFKGYNEAVKGALGVAFVLISLLLGISSGLLYGVVFAVPFWLFLTLAERRKGKSLNLSLLLGTETAYFGLLTIGFMALISQFFSLDMNHVSQEMMENFPELKNALVGADLTVINKMLGYVPGITCLWGVLMTLVNVSMAYNLVVRSSKPSMILSPLEGLKLPFGLWGALAGLGVVAAISSNSLLGLGAVNVILVLMAVFLVEGLSVLKVVLGKQKNGSFLFLVLAGLIFIFNFLLLAVVIVGIFEPWLKLRHKVFDHRRDQ